MKKIASQTSSRKLTLNPETIRRMSLVELAQVGGGVASVANQTCAPTQRSICHDTM